MADELFDLRNSVVLGNYHQAIAEGSQVKVSNTNRKADEAVEIHADRDLLIARAQVGLCQHDAVIAEHQNASHPLLKAAHAWALFHKALLSQGGAAANGDALDAAMKEMQALIGSAKPGVPGNASTIVTLLTGCHLHRDEVAQALQLCGSWVEAFEKERQNNNNAHTRQAVELRSLLVEALLRLNRVDLADKMLQDMRALDDDAVLTMLAGVSVAIAQAAQNGGNNNNSSNNSSSGFGGGDRISEAKSLLQDLLARCGQSVTLLNISGVVSLLSGNQSESEQSLVSSLAKRSSDVDTLSNLAAIAAASKTQDAFNKVFSQAVAANPDASWTKQYAGAHQRFRDASEAFAAAA